MTFDEQAPRVPTNATGPTTVIDSQLVREGLAVRPDAHIERFAAALATAFGALAPSGDSVDALWRDGVAGVPTEGAWFPLARAERVGDEVRLEFAVRPAPPLRDTTRLAVAADERRFPLIKGADGELTASDRAAALARGADDAIYLDARGRVIEAANGAVVGWRRDPEGGGDQLVLPDTDRALPSTTVAAMLEALPDAAAPTRALTEAFTPDEVDELWYVNALHGLTPVVAIDGAERGFDAERLAAWRAAAEQWWAAL